MSYFDVRCDDGERIELIFPSLDAHSSSRKTVAHVVQQVLIVRKLNDKSLSYTEQEMVVAIETWNTNGKSSHTYVDLSTDIQSLQSIYRALSSSGSVGSTDKMILLLFGFKRQDSQQQVERLSRVVLHYSDKLKQLNDDMLSSFHQNSLLPISSNCDESRFSSHLKLLQSFAETWISSSTEIFDSAAETRNHHVMNDINHKKFNECYGMY